MRVVLTGAGGGHFYPLIAVLERVQDKIKEENLIDLEAYFLSDQEYDKDLLFEKKVKFIKIPSGKIRLYFSIKNFFDPFLSVLGFFVALYKLFAIYPDVVFAKGGYSSLPVVFAAKCLFIPIIIHESDSIPGKSNLLASKLAKRIAISYASTIKYFNIKKTAYTGQPVMKEYIPSKEILLKKENDILNKRKKTILVVGGSQGSQIINDLLLESLPELLKKYNVIHQVGKNNLKTIQISSEILLKNDINRRSYKYFSFSKLEKYYEEADLCITRAGSLLFELSLWGIPSIIIPITNSNANHQMNNASLFERAGCSILIEETNFKRNIFSNLIDSILENPSKYKIMRENNLSSFKFGAAEKIADQIVKIGLSHL